MKRLALAALAAAACAPEPAASVSFVGFTADQRTVAYDALDQWCDAVGWCPVVTLDGEMHVELITGAEYATHDRPAGSCGHNAGAVLGSAHAGVLVSVDGSCFGAMGADLQWVVLAHELGHEGVREHTSTGLMRAANPPAVGCVDSWAVRAWCRTVGGCHQDAAGTCSSEVESEMTP